jgi:transposase
VANKHYSNEFKADAVRMYVNDAGATYASVAAGLGMSAETLRNWVKRAGEGRLTGDAAGRGVDPVLDVASRAVIEEENRRLKAEVARLRAERDILKKAAAVFLSPAD